MTNNVVADTIDRSLAEPSAKLPPIVIPDTRTDGRLFKNPLFALKGQNAGMLSIESRDEYSDFAGMQRARKIENNQQPLGAILDELSSTAGRTLSNIGVSVAISVTVEGRRFALMQYRDRDNRHMLLSGY